MLDKIVHFGDNVRGVWYVAAFLCELSLWASGNYCSSKMCSHTNAHTFCQFSEGPGVQCSGYVDAPLSPQEKAAVLTRLNQRRAAAASGRLRGFPTAGNMLKLLWIDELAREAQLFADQCEPPKVPEEHDACRDLYSVSVGQCVASVVGEAPGLRPESMVDMWYMQNRHYKGNVTHYEPPLKDAFGYYGDFAQLVYSKAYMVGCGRSRFMVPIHGRLRSVERLVCNFAPRGPNPGRPIWTVASPGTACPPRSHNDDTMPALCSLRHNMDETLDPDNMLTLEEHILLDTIFEIEKNESLNYVGSIDELYLTKVAIATIVAETETVATDVNFMQKRGIIENVFPSNNIVIMDDILSEITSMKSTYPTNIAITKKSLVKIPKDIDKIKLVGRPRSYNIDDLTYYGVDTRTENSHFPMDDLPDRSTTLGIDYEFVENDEIIPTVPMKPITLTTMATYVIVSDSNIPSENYMTYVESTSTEPNERFIELSTSVVMQENVTYLDNSNETTALNDTDAILDEYLNDPETFRQLQEELERMEKTMSTELSSTERSEKVRRDLRSREIDLSDVQREPENDTANTQKLGNVVEEEEKNRTVDRTPMLNMVMKYMPYLKDYKNGFLKSAVGSSVRNVLCNFILVLTVLVINVL